MNTNNLNTALYEKMATEQEKYRDWLKSQPPEEVLNHAYEYTIREDIVMAMEELELIDTQAQALLESPSPLADVYRYFEKLETGYMDVIRDSIESRADDVCRAKEELRTTPVYPHSAAYASEHGEMAQYNLSYQANSACKEAIKSSIGIIVHLKYILSFRFAQRNNLIVLENRTDYADSFLITWLLHDYGVSGC